MAAQAVDSLVRHLQTRSWVKCPSCCEEWNKLRPCRYLDENGKSEFVSVCVECAETNQGITYASEILPLAGVEVEKKWLGPRSWSEKRKAYEYEWRMGQPEPPFKEEIVSYKLLKNLTAKVSYGGMVFTVVALDSGAISFKVVGQDNERRADNIFAAWSMIGREIRNPDTSVSPAIPKGVRGHGRQKYDWSQE